MTFMKKNPSEALTRFVRCSEPGCTSSSGYADFKSMTLRTGLSFCLDHVKMSEINNNVRNITKPDDVTLIFYDIEMSKDGEIEQIGACVESGQSFSTFIRTSVRTNSSLFLRQITPEYWNMLADEPKSAIERFVRWTRAQHSRNSKAKGDDTKILLAAHYGSCHDHVHILKMMMKWGVKPPNYTLVDTLAIFKTIKGNNEKANLHSLVAKYASWIDHTPHDADSDADALRFVTLIAFPATRIICSAYGISCKSFMDRTGLSMYVPSPIVTFTNRPTSGLMSGSSLLNEDNNSDSEASRSTI